HVGRGAPRNRHSLPVGPHDRAVRGDTIELNLVRTRRHAGACERAVDGYPGAPGMINDFQPVSVWIDVGARGRDGPPQAGKVADARHGERDLARVSGAYSHRLRVAPDDRAVRS